jgi:NADH:ubiquinone oxidoreductase subunit 2 (subunit N)
MIAFTTLALLGIALLSSIGVEVKKDKLLSFFVFILLGGVFSQFCQAFLSGQEQTFSFLWNSSPSGDIKIDIISNAYNYNVILPFFIITLVAVAQNLLFRYEEKRSFYNAILIFNLVALILMITSNNFVQLLCALFLVDILAMFLIKDSQAYRRYILLNMAADMMIFTVLAIINCRVDSLDIREILRYKQMGMHLDFITITGLSAIFMKMGLWGFHIGSSGLQKIRLHRLLNVLFLSSPVGALILLMKFHVLWNSSAYFAPYLHCVCILSITGGLIGSLLYDNFKKKIIYWQMMFWALMLELLCFQGFVWSNGNVYFLLQMVTLTWCWYLLYYHCRRPNSVLQWLQQKYSAQTTVNINLVLITLMIAAMSGTLTTMYNRGNRYYIWFFAVAFVISVANAICQIFAPRKTNQLPTHPNKPYMLSYLLIGGLSAFVLQPQYLNAVPVYGFTSVFVLLCRYSPLRYLQNIYHVQWLQNNDFIGMFYKYVLIKPLRWCGRFLWILIDHLFIERIVIGFFLSIAQGGLHFFRRLHNNTTLGGTMIVLILVIMLWLSYIWGGK